MTILHPFYLKNANLNKKWMRFELLYFMTKIIRIRINSGNCFSRAPFAGLIPRFQCMLIFVAFVTAKE